MKNQSEEFDSKYCYSKSNVLINKFGIRDYDCLCSMEREITAYRIMSIEKIPMKGQLDFKHLQDIHKKIFQDIYEWAGQTRSVNIAKSNMFCTVPCIDGMAEDIFHKLERDKYLLGLSKDETVEKLAYYFGEINALHPFREGNGRSQRVFLASLAGVAGYQISYKGISPDEMLEASKDTFEMKYDKIKQLLSKNMTQMTYKKQREWCEKLVSLRGPLAKECKTYFSYIDRIAADINRSGFQATNKVIRMMEQLHRAAGKELSVKDVHGLLELGNEKEVLKLAKSIGAEFASQERHRLPPMPEQ